MRWLIQAREPSRLHTFPANAGLDREEKDSARPEALRPSRRSTREVTRLRCSLPRAQPRDDPHRRASKPTRRCRALAVCQLSNPSACSRRHRELRTGRGGEWPRQCAAHASDGQSKNSRRRSNCESFRRKATTPTFTFTTSPIGCARTSCQAGFSPRGLLAWQVIDLKKKQN